MKFYPSIEDVFSNVSEKHSNIFFPLISFDLWTGDKFHIVLPSIDYENKDSFEYYNEFCNEDQIAFDYHKGKYKTKSDLNYFAHREEWNKWREKLKEGYKSRKIEFANGKFIPDNYDYQIGGIPRFINYDETPEMVFNGSKSIFLGSVFASPFTRGESGYDIYLFLDKANSIVYQIMEST